ncbi:MAG: alanine racemase [Pseudomonadota bacterium]
MKSTPWVAVDLAALTGNFHRVAKATPNATPAAVVKCDAYGLGLVAVSRTLAIKEKCRIFFVAHAETGARLRAALADIAPQAEIFIFNGPFEDTLELFRNHRLTPVLNSLEQVRFWATAEPGAPAAVHVDTGMNRLGLPEEEIAAVRSIPDLSVNVIMSHFACASTPGAPMLDTQYAAFRRIAAAFPGARASLASTGGAMISKDYGFDLTRLGVGVYGVGPFDGPHPEIQPVARLVAPVIQVRRIPAGATTGYDQTFLLERDSVLATVALGYGDGFPRAGSNKARVFLAGAPCPIVGRISMDLIVIDATDAPRPVATGDEAEFYGPALPIEAAAAACGTIGYELLTGLGPRVERRYLWNDAPADPHLTG